MRKDFICGCGMNDADEGKAADEWMTDFEIYITSNKIPNDMKFTKGRQGRRKLASTRPEIQKFFGYE